MRIASSLYLHCMSLGMLFQRSVGFNLLHQTYRQHRSNPLSMASTVNSVEIAKDLKVSPIGVGAWAWGDRFFWSYDETQDKNIRKAFFSAAESEVLGDAKLLVDTAEVYGNGRSEVLCGIYYDELKQRSPTKDVALATKFAPLPWRFSRKGVVQACEASFERMDLEGKKPIDLYQLHWPGILGEYQDKQYWDGIADCVEKGLVTAVGVSNYGSQKLRKAHAALAARGIPIATNQIQFSLLSRGPESDGVLRACDELGVKVLAYSPLAQGVLTGKYNPSTGNLPKGPRAATISRLLAEPKKGGSGGGKSGPSAVPLLAVLKKIGDRHAKTEAQVSLNWCVCKGTIPIPGARNTKQAGDNMGAIAGGWRLTADEVFELDVTAREAGVEMFQMPMMKK